MDTTSSNTARVAAAGQGTTNTSPRVLLTVEAAADQLSISRTRMYRLLKDGAVESVLIGRLRRIPATALNEFAARLLAAHHAA